MAVNWAQVISSVAPAAAQVASAYAGRNAAGRQAEATTNQRQDVNALSGYQTDVSKDLSAMNAETQAKLDRALGMLKEYEAELSAPGLRASNSVRGDLLANLQDAGVSAPSGVNVTSFSGGLRPSLLSGNSRALGQQMSREALLSQMEGTPTPYADVELPDFSSILSRNAPELTELPQPSAVDRVMEGIGTYGSMAAAIQQALQQRQQQPTTASTLATRPLPTGTAAGPAPTPMPTNWTAPTPQQPTWRI